MFGGNCGGCSSAYTWEQAQRLFERTPLPKTRSRGRPIFEEYQRPLDGTRQWHYRIEEHDGGKYYDMCLYRTVMARYYRPTAEGRRVLYAADPRALSSQYMWCIVGASRLKQVTTTEGLQVASPLYDRQTIEDGHGTFSADLFFDPEGKLVVAKSAHTPHGKSISSPEDRAKRAALQAKFDNLVLLAVMRLPELERSVEIDRCAGRPFERVNVPWQANRLLQEMCMQHFDLKDMAVPYSEAFFTLCQLVYNTLASKRVYISPYHRRATGGSGTALGNPITPADFQRSLWRKLQYLAGVNRRTGTQPLPQFMAWAEYPGSSAEAL